MKNLLYICISMFLFACAEPDLTPEQIREMTPQEKEAHDLKLKIKADNNEKNSVRVHELNHFDFNIVTIDSCQYILYNKDVAYGSAGGLTHKANCKNSFHKTEK